MKKIEGLNEIKMKSAKQAKFREYINKKMIAVFLACIICAVLLALLWAAIYTTIQRRRLQSMSESYTISLGSIYEDVSTELIGIERSSSDSLKLYLKVINPNAETLDITSKGIYFNDVCVQDSMYNKTIDGDKETIVTFYIEYSNIIENLVGETITDISMRYIFEGEDNNIRECSDSGFTYKIGDVTPTRVDSVDQTDDAEDLESQTEEKADIYGTLDGSLSDRLKIKFSNVKETDSYVEFIFLAMNETEEDVDAKFWYEANVNDYTLSMKDIGEFSSHIVPAGGTAVMILKYYTKELQYCGISMVEKLRFYIGEADSDWTEATEVSFKDLGIKMTDSSITENAINNRIPGELSVSEMSEGINIYYVGYETLSSHICLYFDVANTSDEYYGFAFWFAAQVNKCAVKMKSTSEISGALDGNNHVLLTVKFALDDLRNAEISSIDEVMFNFADNLDNKDNMETATFYELDIPID